MSREIAAEVTGLQAHSQADAPSGAAGPVTDRNRLGQFAPGNRAALVAGARSLAFWQAVRDERARLRAELLAARGFTSEADAPTGLRLAADGAAQACLLRDASFERLVDSGGPVTDSGRTRRVLTVWQGSADRALAYLKVLGLERVEKDLTTEVSAWQLPTPPVAGEPQGSEPR